MSDRPSRQALLRLVKQISRMETEEEVNARTNDDGMSGDDAVEALSGLIVAARKLVQS